jgi:2-dehydro-3-deoxyphosphogluconate aldolase/(4S)-4-hydroxy-2-oxoglutarate aldolase
MTQSDSAEARRIALENLFHTSPVVPVITIERADDAVPLAEALIGGGIQAVEITLRTPVAWEAAKAILARVPKAIVGIGTVLTADDLAKAQDLGAAFALSPGCTPALLDAASTCNLPFVPGIATASDLMAAVTRGFDIVKFFPAVPAGGIPVLKALSGPFPTARFCPTGGISEADAEDWLALPNVLAIGGSWIAPSSDIKAGAWAAITERARRLTQAGK